MSVSDKVCVSQITPGRRKSLRALFSFNVYSSKWLHSVSAVTSFIEFPLSPPVAFVSPVLFFSFSHVAIEPCTWVARRAVHNMSMKRKKSGGRGGMVWPGHRGWKSCIFYTKSLFIVVTTAASCEWNGVTRAKQERISNEVHWIMQQPWRSDLIGREAFHERW